MKPETPACELCAALPWEVVGVQYVLIEVSRAASALRKTLRCLWACIDYPLPPEMAAVQASADQISATVWTYLRGDARPRAYYESHELEEHRYVVAEVHWRMLHWLRLIDDRANAAGLNERFGHWMGTSPPPASDEGRAVEHERMRQVWLRAQRWAHAHGAFDQGLDGRLERQKRL